MLPRSGRTPTVGSGGVGGARGETPHYQHCGPGRDDDDEDLTPRPRFVERIKKQCTPRMPYDMMLRRDAGFTTPTQYRTRNLAPID